MPQPKAVSSKTVTQPNEPKKFNMQLLICDNRAEVPGFANVGELMH